MTPEDDSVQLQRAARAEAPLSGKTVDMGDRHSTPATDRAAEARPTTGRVLTPAVIRVLEWHRRRRST